MAKSSTFENRSIAGDGVVVSYSAEWFGRSLWLDQTGERAVLEIANFEFSQQEKFYPPVEVPANETERIVGMSGTDVLIVLVPRHEPATPLSVLHGVGVGDLVSRGHPLRPVGRGLLQRSLAVGDHNFDLSVTFGSETPSADAFTAVNEILNTLAPA